jgi:AcrR family transcriptional regulator
MGVQSKGHIDLRVKRSQAAIRSAVVSLISEKPTQDITAKDVAERALINKKTFYAHYPSVRAVLREIENDAVSEVSGIVESGDLSTPSGLSKVLAQLKALSADGASAFGSLARTPARTLLSERLRRELSGRLSGLSTVSSQLSASLSSRVSCAVDFAAGGIVSLLASWLFGERSMSEDELSQTVIQSVRSCLGSVRSMATAPTGDANCA